MSNLENCSETLFVLVIGHCYLYFLKHTRIWINNFVGNFLYSVFFGYATSGWYLDFGLWDFAMFKTR